MCVNHINALSFNARMKLSLSINKTVEQNAEVYFAKAKKLKKKIEGIDKAVTLAKENQAKAVLEHTEFKEQAKQQEEKAASSFQEKQWYEKFRWFFSSEGFLVIGGRDATSNEVIIKKYMDKEDIVFHTDMAGSPFFVVKVEAQRKEPGEQTLQETANATLIFSRAWKKGLTSTPVFYVTPEQVSKTANPGEYMPKGAFMIRGKTTYLRPKMECALGYDEALKKIICGPLTAIQKYAKKYLFVQQGDERASDVAKKMRAYLKVDDLDAIIRALPSGECKMQVPRESEHKKK